MLAKNRLQWVEEEGDVSIFEKHDDIEKFLTTSGIPSYGFLINYKLRALGFLFL